MNRSNYLSISWGLKRKFPLVLSQWKMVWLAGNKLTFAPPPSNNYYFSVDVVECGKRHCPIFALFSITTSCFNRRKYKYKIFSRFYLDRHLGRSPIEYFRNSRTVKNIFRTKCFVCELILLNAACQSVNIWLFKICRNGTRKIKFVCLVLFAFLRR